MSSADPQIPVDEITQEWWDATRQQRLVIQHCGDCGHWQHYPRALCTGCGGTRLAFDDVSGAGEVDTWTEVMRGIRPGLPAPYIVARVRLAEGPVLLTRLAGVSPVSDGDLIGQRVRVSWEPLPDRRHLPVFGPDERSLLWTLP